MFKVLLKLIGYALAGFLLLVPGLRGFYLLHHDPDRAQREAREFLLQASEELDRFAEDLGGRFPEDLNALEAVDRARSGVGIGHVWDGVLRAPLSKAWSNLQATRNGALLDPWGTPYLYRVDDQGEILRLETLGSDGAPGGEGYAQDLIITKRERQTAFSFLDEQPLW